MNIEKLQFFDNSGYNLNFERNENGYWEGTIYLPKVSVGLYANTTIYILEELNSPRNGNDVFTTEYAYPTGPGKLVFTWDRLNSFVDEFFMFNFDDTYTIKETSALVYTPNDGPDCNTLIINRFDKYEVTLDNEITPKALPVHIAFMASEKYDASTYNRTLVISYNNQTIARIKFYAETVEEDERLKIWNANLGYNITPKDTMIFYKSDIKEYMPDYILLNEKRKELMMEGSNIYPYIGSYLAIINAIKFFGYDNLNIIEYWRCINPDDENFGKIYHSSKYSLTKKETLRIGGRNIVLPNKDYRKINALALVYSINKPNGQIDEWELPKVTEQFRYTIEEALIKLFALRKKLNKEFMPGTSRIIDIIGEANYFGIQAITKIHDDQLIDISESTLNLDFDVYPKKYAHITDNEYFNRYINLKINNDSTENIPFTNQMVSDILGASVSTYLNNSRLRSSNPSLIGSLTNGYLVEYYKNYYREVFEDYTIYNAIENNDDYSYDYPDNDNSEYDYYDGQLRFSAKVILRCKDFLNPTFENCELKFGCTKHDVNYESSPSQYPLGNEVIYKVGNSNVTFDNLDQLICQSEIKWTITMSKDQYDEDLRNVGISKEFTPTEEQRQFVITKTGNVSGSENYSEFFIELPYIGYYDVTMEIIDPNNPDNKQTKTKTKCIKVEPYNIDIIGFYYDARQLPKNLQYEMDEGMYNFIQSNIEDMHGWAVAERKPLTTPDDFSMPIYSYDGSIRNTGPYYNENIEDEWYLADNITYEIAKLLPLTKYTRYIRSGVDVKPYTWFLLGYEYSKIAGKVDPHWTIVNNNEEKPTPRPFDGRYLTLLLKKEGEYTVTLSIKDKNGNEYSISRNIIVVSKSANYKLYQPFKKDYDFLTEQTLLKELNEFNEYELESPDIEEP